MNYEIKIDVSKIPLINIHNFCMLNDLELNVEDMTITILEINYNAVTNI